MKIVALIAARNERRFIAPCLEHLRVNGIQAWLIDNESTDGTAELAAKSGGDVLLGSETLAFSGRYRWAEILRRKERLAQELDADWFIHLDPDEFRSAPAWAATLLDAIAEADRRGFNAINFTEFCFIPTRESPEHDHANFRETLRSYYPFAPRAMNRVTAWKRQPRRVELALSGGHVVEFPGRKIFPEHFPMRHYIALGRAHAIEKYCRTYDPGEMRIGWHGWRAKKAAADFALPPAAKLKTDDGRASLDARRPWRKHWLERVFTG